MINGAFDDEYIEYKCNFSEKNHQSNITLRKLEHT